MVLTLYKHASANILQILSKLSQLHIKYVLLGELQIKNLVSYDLKVLHVQANELLTKTVPEIFSSFYLLFEL